MGNSFFDAFNPKLKIAENKMGEPWYYRSIEYPAIAIDDLRIAQTSSPGGVLSQANMTIHVRRAVFKNSGAVRDNIVKARGQEVRILTISDEGDDAVALICGPVSVRLPNV